MDQSAHVLNGFMKPMADSIDELSNLIFVQLFVYLSELKGIQIYVQLKTCRLDYIW